MAEEMSRRPYNRAITSEWIVRHPRYVRYMVREFSCLFIGAYTLILVAGLKAVSEGRAEYEAFLECLRSPASVVFQMIALAFAVYHSITWFKLTPKALPLQIGEAFVPDEAISGAHFAAWGLLSLAVLILAGAF